MIQLEQRTREPYKEYEKEKRRGLKINAGFFGKLSTLNAGSMAVAGSIVLAIKSQHPDVTRTVLHEILIVVVLLWLSLLLAILNNFFAAVVAQKEAAYAKTDFDVALTKLVLSTGRGTIPIDDAAASQAASLVEGVVREGLRPKRRRLAKITQILYPTVTVMGYLSMFSFLAAYTLVMIYLLKLW
jgi:hypothetical protein